LLLENAARVLLDKGYGLSYEQMNTVETVIEAIENDRKKCYLLTGRVDRARHLLRLQCCLKPYQEDTNP
jgi:hypothetical protein